MTSIKQEDFPYRNIIYNDKKEVKIESIKPLKKFDKKRKPPGVWYGIKHHWAEFINEEFNSNKIYKVKNLFKLNLNKNSFTDINKPNKNKILVLKKVNDFVKFTNKYKDSTKTNTQIKWSDVMKDYGGIENPKIIYNLHNWKFANIKKDYSEIESWYYGWDVPSGVIWNNKVIHEIIKII